MNYTNIIQSLIDEAVKKAIEKITPEDILKQKDDLIRELLTHVKDLENRIRNLEYKNNRYGKYETGRPEDPWKYDIEEVYKMGPRDYERYMKMKRGLPY